MGVAVGSVHKHLSLNGVPSRKMWEYETTEKQREAGRKAGKNRKGEKQSESAKKKIAEGHINGGIGHKKKRTDEYMMIYFPDHPNSTVDGYIMEHILVMEALIGRHLNQEECVHHKNGIRDDNKKENLLLMTKSEHMSFHMKKRHAEKRRNDLSIQ